MNTCYIGVDSGITGGIVLLKHDGSIIDWTDMPVQTTKKGSEINVLSVRGFLRNASPDFFTFVLEEPGGAQSYKAAVSMAGSFHSLRALAVLMGYKFVRITPNDWQKPMLRCKEAKQTKPAALTMARQLWPKEDWLVTERCTKPHEGAIDAGLIAEWARREGL